MLMTRRRMMGKEPKNPYADKYFTIRAISGSGTLYWEYESSQDYWYRAYSANNTEERLWFSKNGGAWSQYSIGYGISMSEGDSVRFKSSINPNYIYVFYQDNYETPQQVDGLGHFQSWNTSSNDPLKFAVEGNVLSLLYSDSFEDKTVKSDAFIYLLGAMPVVTAENLVLPPNTASKCYSSMFSGCTSLTAAPALPATELKSECYSHMFRGCTNLITAPVLPATTLASKCYHYMFNGCTALNYVKAMFTTTPSSSYTSNWLYNVAASGTFVKNSAATWTTTGASGVPSGWTVQTAST